jgi:hypothetical protein
MPDVPISLLPPADSLTGSEMFPLVQGGATKRANVNQLPGGALDVVAAENISAFQAVTADGHVANSNNSAYFGAVVGVAPAAINSGFAGQVFGAGEITNPVWTWSPNQKLFLNGISLSNTPPTSGVFSQMIAIARTATTIVIQIETPILL